MKKLNALIVIMLISLAPLHSYAFSEPTKEKLLEETLFIKYIPVASKFTGKVGMCEKITKIKRLGGNRIHEVTLEFVTFEKAHMPPYDHVQMTLIDTPDRITVTNIIYKKNLTPEQFKEYCSDNH